MKTIKRIFFAVLLMTITSGAFAQMSKTSCENILTETGVSEKTIYVVIGATAETYFETLMPKGREVIFKEDYVIIKTHKVAHYVVYEKIKRIVSTKKVIRIVL